MTSIAPTHPNLVYARIDDRALPLDLYLPTTGPKPCPLILWIHGGAWRGGIRAGVTNCCRWWKRAGRWPRWITA